MHLPSSTDAGARSGEGEMSDQILEPPGSHEPNEHAKTPKKAAASGWIGSALEYYDFFIYAQAAALVFPNIFFPKGDPQIAIIAAFATFGVGYVARPIGAFVLGHLGDTHGRKNMLVLCMMLIGISTFGVAFLPLSAVMEPEAFQSWGWRIPFLLSVFVVIAGLIIRRKVDETPAFQEEATHGEVPKAPIKQAVSESGPDMLRVFCMSLMNVVPTTVNTFGATFATNAAYGNGFTTTTYLWISVVGNVVAVILIPFVGNLTDRIGRRPCMIVGALGSGVMGFLYLYAVDSQNVTLAFISAILMWGIVYQGYNATFPAYYQELFPTRTRVTAFAVSQNLGTMATAFLPAIFATVAPPGSNVPLIVGSIVLGISIVAAVAAYTARETYRLHMNDLGVPGTQPVPLEEYNRIRAEA